MDQGKHEEAGRGLATALNALVEVADIATNPRPPRLACPALAPPVEPERLAVPPRDGLGPDEDQGVHPTWPGRAEPDPERASRIVEPGLRALVLEDRELLTQGQVLEDRIVAASGRLEVPVRIDTLEIVQDEDGPARRGLEHPGHHPPAGVDRRVQTRPAARHQGIHDERGLLQRFAAGEGHAATGFIVEQRILLDLPDHRLIRLAGQGGTGYNGGPPGDLYLEVWLRPHPLYQVEGKDVFVNLPITPWEAALGGKVQVPTLGGKVDLNITAGARSGQKLRLKGRGLPVAGEAPGDQYAVLQIMTPPADTDARRALYEKMARDMPFNPRAHLGG